MFSRLINRLLITKVFSFDEDKILMLNKVPFIMFPAGGMAKFIQKVGEEFGDKYLYQLGYDAGLMVGKEFVEELGWLKMGIAKRMNFIFKMFEVMGFGKMKILIWDSKNNRLLYRTTHHPTIEKGVKFFGKKEKICKFYMGIEAAHWHNEMGVENCKLKETQCIKNRDKYCEWSYNYFKKS